MQRTIIIGDVHGCLRELESLLIKVNYQPSVDRLISVGDLINKGPHSVEVLRLWRLLKAEVVLGNHELGLLKSLNDPNKKLWQENIIQELGPEAEDFLRWMSKWPTFIEHEEFLVVHGGLVPNLTPSETPKEWLTSIRTWDGKGADLNNSQDPPWHDLYDGERLVVYGHWAAQGLKVKANSIGLDSGCCYGRALSALILPERTIVQQPAFATYQSSK